jgi:hypothetical protein
VYLLLYLLLVFKKGNAKGKPMTEIDMDNLPFDPTGGKQKGGQAVNAPESNALPPAADLTALPAKSSCGLTNRPRIATQTPCRASASVTKKPKVSRKLPTTPRSRIKSALRQVWLRSRERAACLKAAGHCCEVCGVHASVAKLREIKLQVHHRDGINWDGIVDAVIKAMLPDPSRLQALCEKCHAEQHKEQVSEANIAREDAP